jgi:hypothetical protein
MLGAVGVLVRGLEAIGRFLFRRRSPVSGDPAEELRRKLAEAREYVDESEPADQEAVSSPAASEPPLAVAGEPEPPADDLESLRRSVHERARALTEEMRGPNEKD